MSSTRRQERAAITAAEIAEKEARKAAGGTPQLRVPLPAKESSVRSYHAPEPVARKKVVRTVNESDGLKLLNLIRKESGGRDIIVMMRDSERPPQELAEDLRRDEDIVINILNRHGGGKDGIKRLMFAIEQAASYLDKERPVTTGLRKKREEERHREKRKRLDDNKVYRTREFVIPTLDEVLPKLDDQHIVLRELKDYLELNAGLRDKVMSASSDQRAARILTYNVGPRFDTKVKVLLEEPSKYQDLLIQAGVAIRSEVRKYDTSETPSTLPATSIQESPEAVARQQANLEKWEKYKAAQEARKTEVQSDATDPEAEVKQEAFNRQEEALRRFQEKNNQNS